MQHEKHPQTFAYPERSGKWDECDGCTDDVPESELVRVDGYDLCPECLVFHEQRKTASAPTFTID